MAPAEKASVKSPESSGKSVHFASKSAAAASGAASASSSNSQQPQAFTQTNGNPPFPGGDTTSHAKREPSDPHISAGPDPSTPGLFLHSSSNPAASLSSAAAVTTHFGSQGNHLGSFSFYTTPTHPINPNPYNPNTTFIGSLNPYGLPAHCPSYIPSATPIYAPTMGDYQNAAPPVYGLHFQPPVPDTTNGPIQHLYVPRFDNGAVLVAPPGCIQVRNIPSALIIPNTAATAFASTAGVGHNPAAATMPLLMTPVCVDQGSVAATAAGPMIYYHPAQTGVMHAQYAVNQTMPMPVAAGPNIIYQQAGACAVPQPVLVNGQYIQPMGPAGVGAFGQGPTVMAAAAPGFPGAVPSAPLMQVPGMTSGSGLPPDVTGVGRTAGEVAAQQLEFAHSNGLFTPQDFKPADDDPSRYYYVRELDGNWTQRNRFSIDRIGSSIRWYLAEEGYFYAVRLPE